MQLSMHSDYACRVLMYLVAHGDEKVSIPAIAKAFRISENHLVKVVHKLGKFGFLITTRGRGGGIELGRDPAHISIGEVVRKMEAHFTIVECFDPIANQCPISQVCQLQYALAKARDAFLKVLDGVTLLDITKNKVALARALESTP